MSRSWQRLSRAAQGLESVELEAAHAAVPCDIRRSHDDHVPGCTPRPSESEEVATPQALFLAAVEDRPILVRAAGERGPEPIVLRDGPANVAGDPWTRDDVAARRLHVPRHERGRHREAVPAAGDGQGRHVDRLGDENATHDRDREHARPPRVSVRRKPPRSQRVDRPAALEVGQVYVLALLLHEAEQRPPSDCALADACGRLDVPVLERAPVAAIDGYAIATSTHHDPRGDGEDGSAVRRGDIKP